MNKTNGYPWSLTSKYSVVQFLHYFSTGLTVPVLILFLQSRNLSLFYCLAAIAIFSGATVALEIPSGVLADLLGRKNIYIISQLCDFAATLVMFFSWSFVSMAVGTALKGACRAFSSGSIEAWFVDEFNDSVGSENPRFSLQKTLAGINTVILFGLSMGTSAGGFLPDFASAREMFSERLGIFSMNIILTIIFIIMEFVFVVIFIHDRHPNREHINSTNKPTVISVFVQALSFLKNHAGVLLLMLSCFAWGFGISALEQLWQPRFRSILPPETGTWIFGFVSTGYFLAGMIGNLVSPTLCKIFRHNYPAVLFVTRLLMGVSFFVLAKMNGVASFITIYLVLFSFNGMANSPQDTLFHGFVPHFMRATMLSFASFCLQAGSILGLLVAGALAEKISIPAAWIPCGAVIALSAFIYLFIPRNSGSPSQTP